MKFLKFFPIFFLLNIALAQQTIKDLTVNDFKVVNTKQGSKPCPEMTETQRNAIPSPQSARCIYNTTSGKLNIYNSTAGIWKAAGGGVDAWATAFGYSVDDLVIQSNKIYQCLTAHTSGTFVTDLGLGRWIEISQGVTDHAQLTSIGTNTHAQIDTHIASTANPHAVTKAQVGLGSVVNADTTTTANITDSTNKRFVTDAGLAALATTSGTNTGDLTTSGASGSTTTTNKLKAPFRQMTPSATGEVDIETGNNNELINPRFEAQTYNDGWTCSLGAMSQAVGPDGFKALGIVSSGAGFECNQTFTSTADLKGTLARFFARVKTSAPNTFVCGLDGGSLAGNRVNCQKVNLTSADKVFSETSGFFNYGSMVYGIAIYSSDTAAFPTVIDDVSMGAAGLTTATITSETVNSVRISSSNTVTDETGDWMTTGVWSPTGNLTITFVTGKYSSPPNCWALSSNAETGLIGVSTTSSVSFFGQTSGGSAGNATTTIVACQKTGADYANSSSSGILSSNGTIVKAGEIVATSSASCSADMLPADGTAVSRTQYSELFAEIGITHGQGNGTTTFNVPDYRGRFLRGVDGTAGRDPDKASRTAMATGGNAGNNVGSVQSDIFSAHTHNYTINGTTGLAGSGPGPQNMYFADTNAGVTTAQGGNETRPKNAYVNYCVRTKGSNLAIIPLAEAVKVPGANQVDHIRFRFGGTTLSNECTTGSCYKESLSTSSPTSISFVSTGLYNIVFPRTYTRLICFGSGYNPTVNVQASGLASCNNCSFTNFLFSTGATPPVSTNVQGFIDCLGTY